MSQGFSCLVQGSSIPVHSLPSPC